MDLSFLFSSASLIICGFSFVFFRAYLRRRTGPERILAEFREEADKLIAEIDAITDRDAGLVAERIKNLRDLLEDVDRRIAVYTREVNRGKNEAAAYSELGLKRSVLNARESRPGGVTPFPPEKPETESAVPPKPAEPQETATKNPEAAGDGNRKSPGRPRFIRSSTAIEPKPPSFAEAVEKLAGAGLSSELIASRLGTTLAEVDLAIALLRRAQAEKG
jgi:DNA-directed RNA polymerase specialized sigma24 family protein